jgi:hypothetical protein
MRRFSQEDAMAVLLPAIEIAGSDYEKHGEIEATEAEGGEYVVTITGDGRETDNTANPGDFIVTNATRAREQYIVPRESFLARHERVDEGRWRPTGRIRALRVTANEPFSLEARWRSDMPVKPGDYVATPLPTKSEVYRIAAAEFAEVYRPCDDGGDSPSAPA